MEEETDIINSIIIAIVMLSVMGAILFIFEQANDELNTSEAATVQIEFNE